MEVTTLVVVLSAVLMTLCAPNDAKSATPNVGEPKTTFLQEAESRIVGGEAAVLGQFPWHVALSIANSVSPYCGGALIRPKWVLTAAWCLRGFGTIDLIFGAVDLAVVPLTKMTVNSQRFQIHPQYDNTVRTHDVALISLPTDVTTLPSISPISLAVCLSNQQLVGKTAELSGFGKIEGGLSSPILRWASVPAISNADCIASLGLSAVFPIDSNLFCTAVAGKGACTNDRGSPLVMDVNGTVLLVGTVTYSVDADCTAALPTVYSSVISHRQWIWQVAGEGGEAEEQEECNDASSLAAASCVLLLALTLVQRSFLY